MTSEVWFFTPERHKTEWKGKSRVIAIGPRAQEVLQQFFTADAEAYLFDPRRAVDEYNADRSARRKTPYYPSHQRHNAKWKAKQPKKLANRYTAHAYAVAVSRAIDRANLARIEAGVELELHIPGWAHLHRCWHGSRREPGSDEETGLVHDRLGCLL